MRPAFAKSTVALDGVIYSYQRHGGISRMLDELIPRLCARQDRRYELWTWTDTRQPVPVHPLLSHHRARRVVAPRWLRPSRLAKVARNGSAKISDHLRERSVARSEAALWHATLYWIPASWRRPAVTSVYDLKEELFPDIRSNPEVICQKHAAITRADLLLAISDTTRQDIERVFGIDSSRIIVVPLAPSEVFRSAAPLPDPGTIAASRPFVLFVGRRDAFKNFDLLLTAYCRWRDNPGLRLVIAGPRLQVQEERKLEELGIRPMVKVVEYPTDVELTALYHAAACLVFPSIYEGFGLPILEALACGCPVLAARVPSSLEVAGEFARFFDPHDPESLLHALQQTLGDRDDRRRIEDGRARALSYTWDDAAQAWADAYDRLAS